VSPSFCRSPQVGFIGLLRVPKRRTFRQICNGRSVPQMRRRLSTINQNIAEILASTTPSKTTLRTIRLHFHYNVAECGESFGAIGGVTRKMTRVKFRLSFSDGTFRCELPDVHQTQSLEEPRKYLWKVVNDSLHFPLSSYNKYSGVG
jgi:hypothetical protein